MVGEILKKLIYKREKLFYIPADLGLLNWMNDEQYLRYSYKKIFKRDLNLDNPRAYTEKLAWMKLYWRSPLAEKCADKYLVRDYVKEKLGNEVSSNILPHLYNHWEDIHDISLDSLPDKFVLKPTNGTGDVYVCKNKKNANLLKIKKNLKKNVDGKFAKRTREWTYYNLTPTYMAEELLEDDEDVCIKDYKFFCFNGEPKFMFVCSERNIDPIFDFYDMNWNHIPVKNGHENSNGIKKPDKFEEMKEIARILSEDFPHVRVDLYFVNGKIYFSELTFFHFGGFTTFNPDKYDFVFGEYFILPEKGEVKRS